MLCLGLGVGTIACGDDDDSTAKGGSSSDGGTDDGGGGSSGKNSGSSGKTGSGSSGKSGGSGGDKASGSGGKSSGGGDITPDEAAAGACDMMGMSSGGTMCTGIDEYTQCAMDECMIGDCTGSGGDCADYLDCFKKADDPCNADCTPSDKCTSCLTDKEMCATQKCISKLQCGTRKDGGACDMLEDCCKDMMGSIYCSMVNLIVVGGDESCQQLIDAGACGGGPDAGAGSNGGASGSTGGSDKTCDDLKACCDGLEMDSYKMACMQAYDAIKSSGDAACGQVYTSLSAIGCK